jgi:hypothetical protein
MRIEIVGSRLNVNCRRSGGPRLNVNDRRSGADRACWSGEIFGLRVQIAQDDNAGEDRRGQYECAHRVAPEHFMGSQDQRPCTAARSWLSGQVS